MDEPEIDADAEDEWGNNLCDVTLRDLHARKCVLPCGDIHVCSDCCQYAVPDRDGNCVCPHTGRITGRVCEARTDHSTGRSTFSVDPDATGGAPMGGWRKKVDLKKASAMAYRSAAAIDDSVMPASRLSAKPVRAALKRGALCVDQKEQAREDLPKRARTSKKDVWSSSTLSLLVDEASVTLIKMLGKPKNQPRPKPAAPAAPAAAAVDPRLLDRDILYNAALRKYCKERLAIGGLPSLDDVHNISLAVVAVVVEEQRKQLEVSAARCGRVSGLTFKARAARMAVALWTGACQTPYLAQARRGCGAFKPFCCGAFIAMKRGLTLADGTVLVPRCDEFSDALPCSRTIAADPVLKSLHASSHRGLCTIHRCIASVDAKQARGIFAEAIHAARSF